MLINVNIPMHPILDESDMYVANPDITTWLQSQASLFSRLLWTACCCKLNDQSSGCHPKCCYNHSEFFFPSWSIIAVTAKYSIAVAHLYFHSFFSTMEVNGAPKQPAYKLSSKYLPLCSAKQRHSYRFGTTWGWVNDDRIFSFGWTIPLKDDLQQL